MSEHLVKFAKHDARQRRRDLPKKDGLNADERRALKKIQKEAKAAGSELTSGGKGGLSPSFVLGILRRDKWRCKTCGELGDMKENGGLGVHHKGGIVASKWLSKQGHKTTPANVVTICAKDHTREHEAARAEGIDSSQITPEGDEGTRRDHGKPEAKV